MNEGLMTKFGRLAKAIGVLGWLFAIVALVAPFINGRGGMLEAAGAVSVGVFWWLLGWWLEQQDKK